MKHVNVTRHRCYLKEYSYEDPDSQDSHDIQDSQLSVGSDDTVLAAADAADTVDKEYTVWAATRAAFDAWADDRTRRRCRWRCCRCRRVNRMPRFRMTLMHCRNPAGPSETPGGGGGGGCPRDGAGESHMGPGGCCVILVPRGVGPTAERRMFAFVLAPEGSVGSK
ncbi:hypothetical protein LZ30DRAFT_776337 [Colletotrichum cereale]|nr:hypothetical protein LZ30DRAFT_776337 [Colletotrichum cereale]